MNNPEIEVGGLRVIASGTVLTFENKPARLTFGYGGERLNLVLAFEETERKNDHRIIPRLEDKHTLRLILRNFDNPLGAGTEEPVDSGMLGGRPFFVHFKVDSYKRGNKTIFYTIYVRENR